MKNNSDDEEQDSPDNLPIINIDADPDNANWIRILEQRRKDRDGQQSEETDDHGRQQQQPQ